MESYYDPPAFCPNFVTYCLYMVSETESVTHFLLFGPKYEVEYLLYRCSSNLFSLNCMLLICCHLHIVLRSFCSLLTPSSFRRTLVSSAKDETCLRVLLFMSPIRMIIILGLEQFPEVHFLSLWTKLSWHHLL